MVTDWVTFFTDYKGLVVTTSLSAASTQTQTVECGSGKGYAAAGVSAALCASRTSAQNSAPTGDTQPTGSDCEYGKWHCNGLSLEVCNYITTKALGEYLNVTTFLMLIHFAIVDWQVVASCPTKCGITISGSVDCQ